MSQEELYSNKLLITFFKELGYIGGVVPRNKALKKRLKWFIEIRLLMDANAKEERKCKKIIHQMKRGIQIVSAVDSPSNTLMLINTFSSRDGKEVNMIFSTKFSAISRRKCLRGFPDVEILGNARGVSRALGNPASVFLAQS
ncbi:unnamed protein product [Vicia faba]|uniref:Uncharacterized protein n=1 Tax=Vicia faba TaxID=3906 RepID=A0AAV1AN46_VICFA|nr:unnamed protein product [Vicia faba]